MKDEEREEKSNKHQSNCRNCGAPVDPDGTCPYCGTKRMPESSIEITADYIRFTVG